MATLINGDGNPTIYAAQDADWYASLCGDVTCITQVGQMMAATQEDANTITVADGVIITKEGRRIQIDTGDEDVFTIPIGTEGTTNYYIIGYKLYTDDDSIQVAETFVQQMESATDTIDEDTFKDGATEVYVSLYRVTQTDYTLESVDLLLDELEPISELKKSGKCYFSNIATQVDYTGNELVSSTDLGQKEISRITFDADDVSKGFLITAQFNLYDYRVTNAKIPIFCNCYVFNPDGTRRTLFRGLHSTLNIGDRETITVCRYHAPIAEGEYLRFTLNCESVDFFDYPTLNYVGVRTDSQFEAVEIGTASH